MIVVKKLKPEQYSRLTDIFREDFDSDVPLPQNSDIFAAFEDGKMVGFVLAEDIKMVGQIWTLPKYRNNSIEIVAPLIRTMRDEFDGKEVVGTIASEPRFGKLFENLGMQKIDGEFYRKNI